MLRSACRSRSMKLMSSRPSGSTVRNCESCGTASLTPDVPAAGVRAAGRVGVRAAIDSPLYGVDMRPEPMKGASTALSILDGGTTTAPGAESRHPDRKVYIHIKHPTEHT